jgi:hypothetical protein
MKHVNYKVSENAGSIAVTVSVTPRLEKTVPRVSVSTKDVLSHLSSKGIDISNLVLINSPEMEVRNYHGGVGPDGTWSFLVQKKEAKKAQRKKQVMPKKKIVPRVLPEEV